MAEDAATALSSNAPVQSVIPPGAVDIAASLAPYVVVYDASGRPIAGNGFLNGTLPSLPSGVFDSVRAQGGEDWFSWQPRPGVRSAVVVDQITSAQGGFVMVGRSLREAEIRVDELTLQVGAVFIFAIVGSFLLVVAGALWLKE